mgnify:CR=1 FL=1
MTSKTKHNIFKRLLFWKVLGVFWLTILITIFANIYITNQISDVEERFERVQTKLQDIAHDAIIVYESSGEEALQNWYQSQYTRHKIRVILLNASNQAIGSPVGKSRPPKRRFDSPPWQKKWASLIKQSIISATGDQYILKVLPSPFIRHEMSPFHDYKLYRLLVSFIIITLGSFWLSHSVVRPIKRLTEASEKMAEGDLSVRVSDITGNRSDELAELANAFNHMAERTETLLLTQKQLLRDISHEIRTPLTRQKIAIELAKTERNNQRLLSKIELQNIKLDELIGKLLTFSRLSDGSTPAQFDTIDPVHLIQSICKAAELETHDKHIHIIQELSAQECFQGNLTLVTRAIDNILGNALKYSPEHSMIAIASYLEREYLVIQIKDQGPGIGKEHLPKIFEPFYRVDTSRNAGTGGYGLGLAIVDKIMKQHHGRIVLEENEPQGLTASLYFPLALKG